MSDPVAPEDSFVLDATHPLCRVAFIRCPVCQLNYLAGDRVVLRSFQRLPEDGLNWQAVVMHWECLVFGMVGRRVS